MKSLQAALPVRKQETQAEIDGRNMNSSVVIKSFQNGISVLLDGDAPFSEILSEVEFKFRESAAFFGDAKMAISFEGRTLTEKEEKQLIKTISQASRLHIVCLVGKDEEKNQTFLKAIQQVDRREENDGQFYKGTLKKGQMLEVESGIVILGDVNPGARVVAKRDIIIVGGLYGEAYAGADGKENHFVTALEMSPEKLKIGDFKYHTKEKESKWSIRPKVQPKIAYVKDGRVFVEPLTKELRNNSII